MSNIYQKIWNADQNANGIQPVLSESQGDETKGYVVVNEKSAADPEHRLFEKVFIPEAKLKTYQLAKKLFNNYTLNQSKRENDTVEESEEVEIFLSTILNTAPMQVAREYVKQQTNSEIEDNRWYQIVRTLWFTTYATNNSPDLSGFEHIVVGEQKGSKAGGYHFWYKYYLDDSAALSGEDDIKYHGTAGSLANKNLLVPEISTISYTWFAYDYELELRRQLRKKIGGFFNGCSVEGLMALATVRGYVPARAPKEAIINGSKYELKVFRDGSGTHLRTFYPIFLGIEEENENQNEAPINLSSPIENTPNVGGDSSNSPNNGETNIVEELDYVRIVGALVNPKGHDPGKETVTIANLGNEVIVITNWKIQDKNGNFYLLNSYSPLQSGEFKTIQLKENTAQLSNKSGKIKLIDNQENIVHEVTYQKYQASEQGVTILF